MSGSVHLKKWANSAQTPVLPGYGVVFIDADGRLCVRNENGSITQHDVASVNDQTGDVVITLDSLGGLTEDEIVALIEASQGNTEPEPITKTYYKSGDLTVATGAARFYPEITSHITKLDAWLDTAPTGSDVQLQLTKNGVAVETLTIAAGQHIATKAVNVAVTPTDYLKVNIVGIGSTVPGADLGMRITFMKD